MLSSPFDRFLAACLRLDRDSAYASIHDPRWNWEGLFRQANQEGVLPVLDRTMRESGISAFTPAEVSEFLSGVEYLNAERNSEILAELKNVTSLLNGIGIEPVLLKGAAYLVAGVYSNPGDRYLIDLDLLIPEAHLNQAVDLLMQNGFVPDDSDKFARFRHHHVPLRRPGFISIELHHSLGLWQSASLLPAGEVIHRSLPFDWEGTRVRVPCPEHLVTHLILHSQMQHAYNERIWPTLRAMYDLIVLECRFRAILDWGEIERCFRKVGHHGLLMLHLMQVRDSLALKIPVIPCMTGILRLRWIRRQLIRRLPVLRYVDPIYMYSIVCLRRLKLLRNLLGLPEGRKCLLNEMLHISVYQRMLSDMLDGFGR